MTTPGRKEPDKGNRRGIQDSVLEILISKSKDVRLNSFNLLRMSGLPVNKLNKFFCSASSGDIFSLFNADILRNPLQSRKPFNFKTLAEGLMGICIDLGNDYV